MCWNKKEFIKKLFEKNTTFNWFDWNMGKKTIIIKIEEIIKNIVINMSRLKIVSVNNKTPPYNFKLIIHFREFLKSLNKSESKIKNVE